MVTYDMVQYGSRVGWKIRKVYPTGRWVYVSSWLSRKNARRVIERLTPRKSSGTLDNAPEGN